MKPTTLRFSLQRLFLLTLISFVAVAAMLAIAASANKANRAAKARAQAVSNSKAAINPSVQNDKQRNAPLAPVITATLTDNITAATKVVPGGTINYTAVITNNGAASPADDATNLVYSDTLDANTTLVAGSVHASPIAFNDTYNWVGNTQLDTAARALPTVTANDIAVNPPGGTDTFTLTGIAGGATALGGTVTLTAGTGAFVYTPPIGRPNIGDGATVQDSFTYTITSSADPTLTSVGTVRINLTGRVWYLQAGAAGDGRSNTPSSSPAAMSTAADKSTDVFYIFSNAASLNGPFSVDAGQQLLGQGVNLVVSSITLFNSAAPTPTTTNTAGNCVSLAGAPGNNTLAGFNIGTCTGGTAITGANVGTLNVSTLSINTNGGALDLTGVGAPTVSVVLGGTTSTAGAKNVNLVGLNGTIDLAGGALSGATGNSFDVNGGTAAITFTGTINNSGARQVNVANKTGGSVALSGAVGGTGTGINLATNTGATISFTGGITLSTAANSAFSATGGGTVTATQNNTSIVNTLTTTTGTALTVTSTTIGAAGLTFRSISSTGAANGINLNATGASGGLTVTGNGATCTLATQTCDGGSIQSSTGAGITITSAQNISLTRMKIQTSGTDGIATSAVNGFTLDNSIVTDSTGAVTDEGLQLFNTSGTLTLTNIAVSSAPDHQIFVDNNNTNMTAFVMTNSTAQCVAGNTCQPAGSVGNQGLLVQMRGNSILTSGAVTGCTFTGVRTTGMGVLTADTARIGSSSGGAIVAPAASNSFTVQTSSFTNNNIAIDFSKSQTSNMAFQILNNTTITGHNSHAINIATAAGAATGPASNAMVGKVDGNAIGTQGTKDSGSRIGAGIRVVIQGANTQGSIFVNNNTIRETVNSDVMTFISQNGAATTGTGTARFKITNNVLPAPSGSNQALCGPPNTPCAGMGIFVLADEGDPACNVITSNTIYDVSTMNGTADVYLAERAGPPAGAQLTVEGTGGSNSAYIQANNALAGATKFIDEGGNTSQVAVGACGTFPSIPDPMDEGAINRTDEGLGSYVSAGAIGQAKAEAKSPVAVAPVVQILSRDDIATVLAKATPKATAAEQATIYRSERPLSNHAVRRSFNALSQDPNAPTSGETVTLNTITTFPAGGKSITVKYSATVNSPPLARSVSTQGSVSGGNFVTVNTDDPEPGGGSDPTVTLIDALMTWNGATNTDWNTATNWTPPAGGTQYAPGVSNPAVNDVVIPNVGAQPNISATDIGIYSLNLSNGRTLTITSPRVLTIGGSPGGDLTLDGIISGGNLNLGTGTHVINNAGGTGSLSSTNVATVLSGGTVTLNNNLQAGAVAVNAGGSMIITNRTLSLNGSGPALVVPGGATFTTTGSTVVFNGTAAQQAAGVAYNNLTINNSIGLNVTGVTLTGNATLNGALTLTSSDLATGAFTLSQPNTTASTGVSDVVGTITRTAAFGTTTITFGNPNNQITFAAAGTKPTSLTVVMAKAAPATYTAAVQRNYTISQVGTNTSTATVRLHYLDSELNGNTPETSLGLRRLRNPGDQHWVAAPPPPGVPNRDGAANWVEAPAVPGVSGTDLPTQWTFSTLAPTASNGVITGRITDDHGLAVEGAVIRLAGTQSRKFITDANGFYRFDNVEANGFYTVTPSRVNYTFSPATRSFSLLGESTEATFGATLATSNLENPLDTPEYFVRQHYIDFLGREPDEAGFNFWSDQILECGADTNCIDRRRENGSAAFFLSIEFQEEGGLVDRLYRAGYGVAPQYSAFMPDARTVGLGVRVGDEGWQAKLEANKAAFVNAFANRPAFHQVYDSMDNSLFVDTLIQHTGVSFTATERDALVSGLGAGTMTRGEALRSIAENQSFRNAKFNQAFVMMEYFGYLRRDADSGGYSFWLNKLNEFNGNFEQAEMVRAFIVSGEYRDRFPR